MEGKFVEFSQHSRRSDVFQGFCSKYLIFVIVCMSSLICVNAERQIEPTGNSAFIFCVY